MAEALRSAGCRITQQRKAILDYLARTDAHPSANQVYEEAKKNYPGLSLATVYNTLEMLVKMGLIKTMEFQAVNNRVDAMGMSRGSARIEMLTQAYELECMAVEKQVTALATCYGIAPAPDAEAGVSSEPEQSSAGQEVQASLSERDPGSGGQGFLVWLPHENPPRPDQDRAGGGPGRDDALEGRA